MKRPAIMPPPDRTEMTSENCSGEYPCISQYAFWNTASTDIIIMTAPEAIEIPTAPVMADFLTFFIFVTSRGSDYTVMPQSSLNTAP